MGHAGSTWSTPTRRAGVGLAALAVAGVLPLAIAALAVTSTAAGAASTTPPFTSWSSSIVDHSFPYASPLSGIVDSTTNPDVNSISCPSTTLCVAADGLGNVLETTDPLGPAVDWSATHIDGNAVFTGVSCGSTTFCVAVDNLGGIFVSTEPTVPTAWTLVSPSSSALPVRVSGETPYDLTSVSCIGSTFCTVGASYGGMGVILEAASNPDAPSGWQVAAYLGTTITALSCATSSACIAVSGADAEALSGTTWSALGAIDTSPGAPTFESVSCTSTSSNLCIAGDSEGYAFSFDDFTGGTVAEAAIGQVEVAGHPLVAVDCPATGFCIAEVSNGDVVVSATPLTAPWTASAGALTTVPLSSISCPTTSLCLGPDNDGNIWYTTGPDTTNTWTEVVGVDGTSQLTALSCVPGSSTLCVAADGDGHVVTSTDASSGSSATWSSPAQIDGINPISAISCATTSMCAAVDSLGNVIASTNPTGGTAGWVAPSDIDSDVPLTAISCPSATECIAVDDKGYVFSSTNPTGGSSAWQSALIDNPSTTPPEQNELTSISCPSTTLCVATDDKGYIFTSTDPTGGQSAWTPLHVDASYVITAVSCPTTLLCVAVDANAEGPAGAIPTAGDVLYSTNPTGGVTSWHIDPSVDPFFASAGSETGFRFLACATTANCLAFDSNGEQWVTTEPSSPPGTPAAPDDVCGVTGSVAGAWCAVTAASGQTVNGDATVGPDYDIDTPTYMESLSCVSSSACLLADSQGRIFTGTTSSVSISTTTLPSGFVDAPYGPGGRGVTFSASGGLAPYTWSISGLPAGLSFNTKTGHVSGTPTEQGNSTLTVTVSDSSSPPQTATETLNLTILAAWTSAVVDPPSSSQVPTASQAPFTGISCGTFLYPSGADCVAVDGAGRAFLYEPSNGPDPYWSSPVVNIDTNELTSVSCASGGLPWCVAVDDDGQAMIFNLTSSPPWSAPSTIDTNLTTGASDYITGVSCVSTTFCMVVDDDGQAVAYTSSGWTSPKAVTGVAGDLTPDFTAISCFAAESADECIAVDLAGNAYLYNSANTATPWSSAGATGAGAAGDPTAVSCASSTSCMVVDYASDAFAGTCAGGPPCTWSWAAVDGNTTVTVSAIASPLTAVSCPVSTTMCFATDGEGNEYSDVSGSDWSAATTVLSGAILAGISCTSITACVVVSGIGADTNVFAVNYFSPPCAAFPAAAAACGVAFLGSATAPSTFVNTWAVPSTCGSPATSPCWYNPIDSYNSISALVCPSTTLCVAGDTSGDIVTSTDPSGGAPDWSTSNVDGTASIDALTCPSTSLCVGVDNIGDVLTSGDPTGGSAEWTSATIATHPLTAPLTGVSCATSSSTTSSPTTFCVAVDDYASGASVYYSTNPTGGVTAWSSTVLSVPGFNAISCPSTTLCVAVGDDGEIAYSTDPTGGATAWSIVNIDAGSPGSTGAVITAISCPSTSLCVATDEYGDVLVSTNPSGGGATWLGAQVEDPAGTSLTSISCFSTSLCLAGDDRGGVVGSLNPTGGSPAWWVADVDPGGGYPYASGGVADYPVTCTLCGGFGAGEHYNGSEEFFPGVGGLFPVSMGGTACPATNLCVVGDNAGRVLTSSVVSSVASVSPVGVTSTSPLPAATVGTAYSDTLTAAGGTSPYTWQAETQLPPGLTLSSSGALSGTVSTAGTYTFTVEVTDSSSPAETAFATLSLTATVSTLTITTSTLPSGAVGSQYDETLAATGGTPPYTWSLAPGSSLPQGLSLTSAGVISGVPSGTGSASFVLDVTDSSTPQQSATATLSITVGPAVTLSVTTATLPAATVGSPYVTSSGGSVTLTATGGTFPYTWSLASGSILPNGLSLSASTGVISGTPSSSAQSESVAFVVTDSSSPPKTATADLTITVQGGPTTCTSNCTTTTPPTTKPQGYWLVGVAGGVYPFGAASSHGSAGGSGFTLAVGMAATPDGGGYWVVDDTGGVQSFGDASTLASPQVVGATGIAATPDGKGYWVATFNGGVYGEGDAGSYGSMTGTALAEPVVGIAATPDGKGYWLAAADGGVFSFGDAKFYGSVPGVLPAGVRLAQPVVGIAPTADGKGYWMVAADGGVFSFGDAKFYGSVPGVLPRGVELAQPVVGIAPTPDGKGYWMVAADGGIFTFGDAQYLGSLGGQAISAPVVGMAAY